MNVERMKELVEENDKIHLEDDFGQEKIWNEMIYILTNDLNETIAYLDSIDEKSLFYVSAVFDDISEYFKSKELIECMERNAKRTGVDCSVDIEYAKMVLESK